MMASKSVSSSLKTHQKKLSTEVITGPKLPFETWRIILLDVFRARTVISHPPNEIYEISPLQARLNTFRSLITCKYWYEFARDIFFEKLQAETVASLEGILKCIMMDRHLARCVSKISMSFPVFRDTASNPSRPRKPRRLTREEAADSNSDLAMNYNIRSRDYEYYRPSETMQGQQWAKWHGLCANILSQCTSLSCVSIIFTSNFTAQYRNRRMGGDYRRLFAPPNLDNKAILSGLQASTNLRSLHLTDPTPLADYGPSLKSWRRLKECSITVTPFFTEIKELSDTAFCPPRHLESFRFLDNADLDHEWPLASELTMCTDLKKLELGLEKELQPGKQTYMAIGFLIQSYQHTLATLVLRSGRHSSSFITLFENLAESDQKLHFPHLSTLLLPTSGCTLSTLVRLFTVEQLETLGLSELLDDVYSVDSHEAEHYWKTILNKPMLSRLRSFKTKVNRLPPSFEQACQSMGIEIEPLEM
ncbi:hypothetical protein FRC03_004390 [Tulasnella sp. 419]|nr:hypothetical protein FRC03_004390 [Tulasnella sp. 419]